MKKLSVILTIILFSQMSQAQQQHEPYEALWKNVQKLEEESLPQSALKAVAAIAEKAKKEKKSAQIVKALLYTSKYALTLEEDAQLKIVGDFKTEIEKVEFPVKNVLQSYLANLYWQYFQQNRYTFYDRTETETKVDPDDFRTWDLTTLFKEIGIHFDRSLENVAGLQKTDVGSFKAILHQQPLSEKYRPTLFDLLAHTALQFYTSHENSITRPADRFELDDSEILCEAHQFTQRQIDLNDATSLQAKALLVYQQLIRFHLPDQSPEALVEVDIERLRFIHQNAVFPNKDALYLEILENSAKNLKHHEIGTLYSYEIAALYHQQGSAYVPKTNEEPRWKLKEAVALCDAIVAQFPKSRGADKCRDLKAQILSKNLQLTTEQHISIDRASRLLVDYRNHDGLQLSARKISQTELKTLEGLYPESKQLSFIQKLEVVEQWESDLRNEKDHQSHRTEIGVPTLKNGQYIILATPKEGPSEHFAYGPVQVTNMALIETHTPTDHRFQVVDRQNGKPIPGVSAKLTYQENYQSKIHTKTLVSDGNGTIILPLSDQNWNNLNIELSQKGERAVFGEYYVGKKYERPKAGTDYSCFLFTDRSIYRPGQPLYFKGIGIKNSDGSSSPIENTEVTLTLRDVNRQVVGTQVFRTNAFGSFSGEFILPNNGLTGIFSMEASASQIALRGSTNFSVEEYKRPRFETFFKPLTGTFKVNDSVTVSGTAKAYAGSPITEAKVVYRVKRVVYFPRWHYWHHPYYNVAPQEIAHGETLTDGSGTYQVRFKALPDHSVEAGNLPTFHYEVSADITDLNGETRSTVTTVRVGYHAMTAEVIVPNSISKDSTGAKIDLNTRNLNGEFVPAKGTVKVYKLQGPGHVLRSRPWPAPDYEGFTKEEFKKRYPHDAFANEDNPIHWEKGKLVLDTDFDTGKSKEIVLGNLKKWVSGKYVIELETKDSFGQTVTDVAHTTLVDDSEKRLADQRLFQIKTDKEAYKIGDRAKITLWSASEDLTITVFVEKDRKIVDTRTVHLSNGSESFTVPVTPEDLGGFGISYHFSAYNSFQSGTISVTVPYPKSDLEVETLTFRDKLRPGSEETWSFRVKGPKGDRVAAELLASMYDASLDAFRGHYWNFQPLSRPAYYANAYTNAHHSFGIRGFNVYGGGTYPTHYTPQYYDSFDWFGLYFGYGNRLYRTRDMVMKNAMPSAAMEVMDDRAELEEAALYKLEGEIVGYGSPPSPTPDAPLENSFDEVTIRKNLQETAFFFPHLQTDKEGNVSFSFTAPEALTQWKLQLLAHTRSLESTVTSMETVTQKELMVLPNAPRFLREGDAIILSSKISNLSEKTLKGEAKLVLTDGVTGMDITEELIRAADVVPFSVDALGNTQVSWNLTVPEGLQAVQYQILAKADGFSDGEQNMLPVLTNRMLVTETLPMWVRSGQTKKFLLDKLQHTASPTLKHHKLTLEVTSNPAWYAVQALPYLMEYPYDCNEQTFARYYANSLASHIANSNPRIQEVFRQWADSDALISNLEKNEELKSLLIQETPWLRDAQSETEQKKRIALLFNLDKMKNEQATALNKLRNNQKSSGAWAWFNGGPDNRFITQHILSGLGHLKKLTSTTLSGPVSASINGPVSTSPNTGEIQSMIQSAIGYLDAEFVREYEYMKKYAKDLNDDHLSETQVHYLYMRSFFPEIPASTKVGEIQDYYKGQAKKYWPKRSLYAKGLLALALNRMKDSATPPKILRSLKENSIVSEELGMYWKENIASWYWYQAPIETQALMIEAFGEIEKDTKAIDNLKIWLLKNKQTNQWKTTKATTEAVYALLLQGSDWLSVTDAVEVVLGGQKLDPTNLEDVRAEAGTGYFKTSWNTSEVKPEMAEVQIAKKGEGIAWGALYWQYFENLDKITPAETPLKLQKKLFLKKNTATGEKLTEIGEKTDLKTGNLVRVRIELRSDRDMEFVHMKDMRAAGFEPVNVFSQYKWQDGLGYYESTKDASTNFFFDYLPKGVYVFEYDLRANNAGEFGNGITTIQSMYAPEFSSHSEGVRVTIQ